MELRKSFWKLNWRSIQISLWECLWDCIWVLSLCTLQITIIHKNGVIKLESIWGVGEPVKPIEPEVGSSELDVGSGELNVGPNDLKDRVKLGCSPSTDVEYWDAR